MDNWDKEHRERGNIQLGEEILGERGDRGNSRRDMVWKR
jgi:hypothetical protein